MSQELVIEVLNDTNLRRINFRIGTLQVNHNRFLGVRGAIPTRIGVRPLGLGTYQAAYAYDYPEQLYVSNDASSTSWGRSAVVHECVHAMFDLYNEHPLTRLKNEAAAYITQCLFLRLSSVVNRQPRAPRDPEMDRVLDMADDIVVQFSLDQRSGVIVPADSCVPLEDALFRVYQHSLPRIRSRTELTPDLGIAPAPRVTRSSGGCSIW